MGQYFMPIIGNKNGLNCKVFDRSVDDKYTFAKLMEHSWWNNPFCNSFSKKLYKHKSRVIWCGDYADDDDLIFNFDPSVHVPSVGEIWGETTKRYSVKATDFTLDNKFLLNHDTKEFVDLNDYKQKSKGKYDWVIHPIPLLTAVGNDRGFGDFHEGNVGNLGLEFNFYR